MDLVDGSLGKLTERQQIALRLKYQLNAEDAWKIDMTNKQRAIKIGVKTRRAVRNITCRAERCLRSDELADPIIDFLDSL